MQHKHDRLAERVMELERQRREDSAATTRKLRKLENAIQHLSEGANEETRRKIGRLGLLISAEAESLARPTLEESIDLSG